MNRLAGFTLQKRSRYRHGNKSINKAKTPNAACDRGSRLEQMTGIEPDLKAVYSLILKQYFEFMYAIVYAW